MPGTTVDGTRLLILLLFGCYFCKQMLSYVQAEGLDAEADTEVDKVISELTAGLLEGATDAPTAVPEAEAAEAATEEEEKESEGLQAMKARLESL